ncbi:hypothetical protein SAMN02910358_00614 [Lachnospiraceae bacterium XBB1006]|nr:hypothetical protein SAMN02910358_00614 [Lachnospiraceae bacterium XBB1006]
MMWIVFLPKEKATFDIVFTVLLKNKERQKIYIDVEAQKEFHPGYDLTTRGIYYPARLLSAQADTEFTGEDYDNIKKVYSIWICMNTPNITKDEKKQVADAIVKYSIKPEVVYVDGNPEDVYIGRYDLFTSFFIHLRADETETSKNKLIGMLTVLLSIKKSTSEKKAILENDYGMKMSKEVEKEVDDMCNLSDLIEERAMEQAKIEAIVNMLKFGVSEDKILEEYPEELLAQAKLLREQQQTTIV